MSHSCRKILVDKSLTVWHRSHNRLGRVYKACFGGVIVRILPYHSSKGYHCIQSHVANESSCCRKIWPNREPRTHNRPQTDQSTRLRPSHQVKPLGSPSLSASKPNFSFPASKPPPSTPSTPKSAAAPTTTIPTITTAPHHSPKSSALTAQAPSSPPVLTPRHNFLRARPSSTAAAPSARARMPSSNSSTAAPSL